jgi:hypothetical protein
MSETKSGGTLATLKFYLQSVSVSMVLKGFYLASRGAAPVGLTSLIGGIALLGALIWAALRIQRGGGVRASAVAAQA